MLNSLNLALLLFCPTIGADTAIHTPSILAAVPDEASAIVYCQDFAGLRSRALRNDWFNLLASDRGEPLLEELEQEFRMQTRTQMSDLYAMSGLLQGESVFYVAAESAGFLTTPPAQRAELKSAMLAWLPQRGTQGVREQVQIGAAQVEFAAWPTAGTAAWQKRIGHFAAFVDHPSALGLFSANSREALLETIQAVLGGIGTNHKSSVVSGLEAARGSAIPMSGVEFFIDFTPLMGEAESWLERTAGGAFPDPAGLLGLEQDTWLHVNADLQAGQRVDCAAFLNIPRGTLAANLADCFGPLPAGLPGRLPAGLGGLYAMQWDVAKFYKRARTAFVEQQGPASVEPLDAGLSAAKSMTGVDPVHDLLDLLDGTFALYFTRNDASSETHQPVFDALHNFGVLFGLKNGDLFLDAFEQLIGVSDFESFLDLIEVEGFDVYTFAEEETDGQGLADEFDGGLAFLPQALVLSARRAVLTRHLRAMQGIAGTSALDDEAILGAFDDNPGACFLVCTQLRPLAQQFPALENASAAGPFDSLLISSARRTPDGFRFKLTNR